jgi:hypothetical protein
MRQYLPGAQFVGTAADDFAYWDEIAARWGRGEDLMIVEHDVEVHDQVLPQFRECSGVWCSFPYEILAAGHWLESGTGCVRFTAAVQDLVSAAEIAAVSASCGRCQGQPGCWAHIDVRIALAMAAHDVQVHAHAPPVSHWKQGLGRDGDAGG